MFSPSPIKRILFFLVFDFIISFFTLYFSYNLRFNFDVPLKFYDSLFTIFLILYFLKITIFSYFKLYNVAWRFFSFYEMKNILISHIIAYFIFACIYYFFREELSPFARSILIIDLVLSIFFITLLRLSKRYIIENSDITKYKNTLIIGVNNRTKSILTDKENFEFSAVAICDKSELFINTYINNLKVEPLDELDEVIKKHEIELVIISNDYLQKELLNIYKKLNSHKIKEIKLLTTLENQNTVLLKNISIEDLLARRPKDLDFVKINGFIKNKTILITGAGGSIGSEISRQCIGFGAKQLILLDHSEFNLYTITEELNKFNVVSIMQSVRNKDYLENTFKKYKPDIVIHAAAYKHVPLVEDNILEGISNNIIGTKNCIDLSIKYEVMKFLLISTDKAVRPTNVMGVTKRICELYAQNAVYSKTEIVAVRFGNVLNSSGSVIPKFRNQIKNGGPITVTHPEIKRYFMLISEACKLVLQAASIGKGGEIFILDMGEPIKIVDLAKKMIELSGKEDIQIEYSGLRPGEKLYEELLINDSDMKTEYKSITVAGKTKYEIDKLNSDIEELLTCEDKLGKLKEIVSEFEHKLN